MRTSPREVRSRIRNHRDEILRFATSIRSSTPLHIIDVRRSLFRVRRAASNRFPAASDGPYVPILAATP
jgi:hypothetical protein